MADMPITEMRVSRETRIKDIAGAIAGEIAEGSIVQLSAIGSKALYAAVKGISMAECMINEVREEGALETVLAAHIVVDRENRKRILILVVPSEIEKENV